MQVISFTEARNNLKSVFDAVYKDHDEVVIHRKGKENIVMLPFDEYNAMKETQYLMSSQANRENLLGSLKELREGSGMQQDLIE